MGGIGVAIHGPLGRRGEAIVVQGVEGVGVGGGFGALARGDPAASVGQRPALGMSCRGSHSGRHSGCGIIHPVGPLAHPEVHGDSLVEIASDSQ
eukprot:8125934-Lingulodinium_polyedra.AAC.1